MIQFLSTLFNICDDVSFCNYNGNDNKKDDNPLLLFIIPMYFAYPRSCPNDFPMSPILFYRYLKFLFPYLIWRNNLPFF